MCLYFGVLSETLKLMMLSYIVVEMPLNNTIYIPSSIILLSYLIYFLEMSVYFLEFQLTFCLVKPLLSVPHTFLMMVVPQSVGFGGYRQPERERHLYSVNFLPFYACSGKRVNLRSF